MTTPSAPRYAGLDGLRALAVLLVVGFHLFPAWALHSGFVGVDVFFVISGFLITSLLLREQAASGRIALRAFWTRRARRLLPALAAVVTVSATAAWFIGGDVLVDLGRQVLGAATFSYNWVAVADGASYFSSAQPELFRNLWSLAVEEQFYVLWPLLLPVLLLVRSPRMRAAIALVLAAASAAWGALLTTGITGSGDGLTRAYYGTGSHAFGLLIGVALAVWLARERPRTAAAAARMPGAPAALSGARASAPAATATGIVVLAALVAVATWPGGAALYPGIPLIASLLTAALIAIAVRTGSLFGRALDVAPLRWLGQRSYGIYLWHWPIVVLLTVAITGTFVDTAIPVGIGALALIVTLLVSALSYRVLEQPVRRLGFRGTLQMLGARFTSSPTRRLGAITTVAAALIAVGGTTAAVAVAPPITSSEAAVQAGIDALASASATPPAPAPAHDEESDADGSPADADREASTPTCPADDGCPENDGRPVAPPPVTVPGDRVTAIGDSVMLASAGALLEALPGIQIDAAVSRSMWAGGSIVSDLASQGALRDFVVVGLGTNGPVDGGVLQQIYDTVGPDRTLVLVTAFAPRDWIDGVNADLVSFTASHPHVVVADWSQAIAAHPEDLAGDQIHPGTDGGAIYATTIADAVDSVENQRAEVHYRVDLIRWATLRAFAPQP